MRVISAVPVMSVPVEAGHRPPPVDARVLLAGAFGQGNPGDEALLTAFVDALPGAELLATSSAPEETEARHGLPALARHDVRALARALRAADAVVFAGGTIFKRLHPSSGRPPLALLARGAALAGAVKAQRKLLAIVGAGAGPLDGRVAPRLARSMVRAADLLVLRDDESAARLAAAGAPAPMRVGADAAWTLPLAGERAHTADDLWTPPPARRAAEPTSSSRRACRRADLVVRRRADEPTSSSAARADEPTSSSAVRADAPTSSSARRRRRAVGVAAPRAARSSSRSAISPAGATSPSGSARPSRLLVRQVSRSPCSRGNPPATPRSPSRCSGRLGAAVLEPPADLAAAAASFAGARLVFGLRFHSLVAAAAAGVPFLAFAHEPKLAAAARRLGQPAVDSAAPPRAVTTALLAALDGPAAAPDAVRRERERAEGGFRLLRVLLTRGRSAEAAAVDGLALRPEEWL